MMGVHEQRGGAFAPIRRAARVLALVGAVAVLSAWLLSACGSAPARPDAPGQTGPGSGSTTGGGGLQSAQGTETVVTVPGLPAPAGPTSPGAGPTDPDPAGRTSDQAQGSGTVTAGEFESEGAQETSMRSPGDGTSPTPALPSSDPTPRRTAAPPGGVQVDVSRCAGCTVIATHAHAAGALSAALVASPTGAALVSARPDGSIVGVVNVPYGTAFPVPAGNALPCDASGRCIVSGRAASGTAILSAFQLGADGSWRDVSGNDGFRSATARGQAADVDGDGLLEVAIQEAGGGATRWMVFSWSGDRFALLGCAPAADSVPNAAALSPKSCLS